MYINHCTTIIKTENICSVKLKRAIILMKIKHYPYLLVLIITIGMIYSTFYSLSTGQSIIKKYIPVLDACIESQENATMA